VLAQGAPVEESRSNAIPINMVSIRDFLHL
jgi:hypothetical protein